MMKTNNKIWKISLGTVITALLVGCGAGRGTTKSVNETPKIGYSDQYVTNNTEQQETKYLIVDGDRYRGFYIGDVLDSLADQHIINHRPNSYKTVLENDIIKVYSFDNPKPVVGIRLNSRPLTEDEWKNANTSKYSTKWVLSTRTSNGYCILGAGWNGNKYWGYHKCR